MSQLSLKDILTNPSLLPHRLDAERNTLEFANLPDGELDNMTFHDGRDFGPAQITKPYPLEDIGNACKDAGLVPSPGTHFLFHSAFCRSTLLARILGQKTYTLREPNLILDLANLKRFRHPLYQDANRWKDSLATALALYGRGAGGSGGVLIKPTNIVNNIIPDLLEVVPTSKAILLYSDLRTFLISMLKKGDAGTAFVNHTVQVVAMDSDFLNSLPPEEVKGINSLKLIALLWRMQMEAFARVLEAFPDTRVASLDSHHIAKDPATSLKAVSVFYGLELSGKEIDDITNGPLFKRDAKLTGQSFDTGRLHQENQKIETKYAKALDDVIAWEKGLMPDRTPPWPLGSPLSL